MLLLLATAIVSSQINFDHQGLQHTHCSYPQWFKEFKFILFIFKEKLPYL